MKNSLPINSGLLSSFGLKQQIPPIIYKISCQQNIQIVQLLFQKKPRPISGKTLSIFKYLVSKLVHISLLRTALNQMYIKLLTKSSQNISILPNILKCGCQKLIKYSLPINQLSISQNQVSNSLSNIQVTISKIFLIAGWQAKAKRESKKETLHREQDKI